MRVPRHEARAEARMDPTSAARSRTPKEWNKAMVKLRILAIGLSAVALAASAVAQIDGPLPLAWRWAQSTQVAPLGRPTADGNRIHVAVGGRVYAVDRESGNQLWRFPVADPIDGNFRTTPVLVDGVLVAAATNRQVYGIDPATGEMKWMYLAPVGTIGDPVGVAGKFVAVAMTDNSVMALEAATGKPVWENPQRIFAGIVGGMSSHGSNILIQTGDNKLIAKSVTNQRTQWERRFGVLTTDVTPAVFGDTVYVLNGQWISALNAVTGNPKWQRNVGSFLTFSAAASVDMVAVVTREGQLLAFEPNTGRPISSKPIALSSTPVAGPTIVGQLVSVPTAEGNISLIDPKSGELKWAFLVQPMVRRTEAATGAMSGMGGPGGIPGLGGEGPMGGGPRGGPRGGATAGTTAPVVVTAASSPVAVGGTLLLLARDGSLLAFDGQTGVDLTPPTIRMVWPDPGAEVSGQPPLDLIFRIEDEGTGVNDKTIKVLVDGVPYEHSFDRDGFATVRVSSVGKNRPLNNGRRTITVVASDWFGNEAKQNYTLFIDNTLRPLSRPTGANPRTPTGGPGGGPGGGKGGGPAMGL
ncbi:MAG: PQQ-binding-like beta-propeller repeat protein [Fimbriimonadales bacterium]|nr:PQQ-binding-like beta-propeller repeat protein [Fimbriimonadales bacterium]